MSKLDLGVRVASIADAAMLAELGARAFSATFGPDNDHDDMVAYVTSSFGPSVQLAELEDPKSTLLIAEAGAVSVGYAKLRFGAAPACVPGRLPGEIQRIYADVGWIGRGVGAALMSASLATLGERHCDVAWLAVWEHNSSAIAFYERWGFGIAGQQHFVLGDDVQVDFVMARALGAGSVRGQSQPAVQAPTPHACGR